MIIQKANTKQAPVILILNEPRKFIFLSYSPLEMSVF
jgi:hypothetical protein